VNVFGCADYGYGELGKGLRLGETAQVLGACTNSYAFGGVAVIYFCFVVGVGVSYLILIIIIIIVSACMKCLNIIPSFISVHCFALYVNK
jgi:hypothetical protein